MPPPAGESGAPSGEAMDRVVTRRRPWRSWALIAAGALALAALAFALSRRGEGRSTTVAGAHVTTAPVARGKFDDIIQVRGRVAPLRTTYITTASGGLVEAIRVEDGAAVSPGQPLVELTNTALQLDLISREAQITEQLNNLRGLELAQAQARLGHERELVEVRYQIKRLTRHLATSRAMVEGGASARGELDDLEDELAYARQRLTVLTTTRGESDRLQRAQLEQMRVAAAQLEKNLEIARKNFESLKVKAPATGKLSAFTLEIGQSLSPGDRIGQIDDPDHFKVVAEIDEFYLSRVDLGQPAEYPLDGAVYPLEVAKIRSQVQNGQFQVELAFKAGARASTAVRRGQSAQVRLQLGQPTDAVMVPNAAFYNDTGGAWVFVVSADGAQAVRRKVRLGRRNPQHIEVLDGLSPGEVIVTSPYTSFLDMDRLDLTR